MNAEAQMEVQGKKDCKCDEKEVEKERASAAFMKENGAQDPAKGQRGREQDDDGQDGEEKAAGEKAAEYGFVDRGGFVLEEVAMAAYNGPLDEKRLRRLKVGFLKLLDGA